MIAARGITYDVITTARVAPLSIDWLGQSGPQIVVFSRSCISLWKIANGRDSRMETLQTPRQTKVDALVFLQFMDWMGYTIAWYLSIVIAINVRQVAWTVT